VRIIVNTGVAVLESVTTFEALFYAPVPGKVLAATPSPCRLLTAGPRASTPN